MPFTHMSKRKLDACSSEGNEKEDGGSAEDDSEGTMASSWSHNLHFLYEIAVQEGGFDMQRFSEHFRSIRKRDARSLREDFCGTFSNCCSWVEMHPENTALGIDNDPEVLKWGLEEFGSVYSSLEEDDQRRISVLEQSVLKPVQDRNPFDVVCALNFSYSYFKKRETLLQYFRSVSESLKDDGLFFLDVHGGQTVFQSGYKVRHAIQDEEGRLDGAEYEWEQASWDPITSSLLCHINFIFPDGSNISPAFTYDWRYWGIAELCDVLAEAGLKEQHILWPDVDSEGELTGTYTEKNTGRDDRTWTAYIAAGKNTAQ